MTDWTYYAGSRAPRDVTLELIDHFGAMWRGSRNQKGALVANVSHLRPGDTLYFVYRQPGSCTLEFRARIGKPTLPAPGTSAIDRVGGEMARALRDAGYPPLDSGTVEVVRLADIERTEPLEVEPPRGQNAIHRGQPRPREGRSAFDPSEPPRPRAPRPEAGSVRRGRSFEPTELPRNDVAARLPEQRSEAWFDRYVAVDWSAASRPTRGGDSIWIVEGWWRQDTRRWVESQPRNCPTRYAALDWLVEMLERRGRTLVGFDFAFGYPAGFARAHGMGAVGDRDASSPWLRTARHLLHSIEDSPSNHNNRHGVASALNRAIGGGPGPFWGCHEKASTEDLQSRRLGSFEFPYRGLEEYRITDRRVKSGGTPILSVWKIDQGVSVGGQTLMGIPYLMKLHEAARTRRHGLRIWPFETGWRPNHDGMTVAELFPSLIAGETPRGEIRDRHQVCQCIRRLAELDSRGDLVRRFGPPPNLSSQEEARVRTEEGWILLA